MVEEQLSLINIFSQNIKTQRLLLNLTQEELAFKANVSAVTVSKIERGLEWPSPDTIEKISAALEVNYTCLFQKKSYSNTESILTLEKQLTEIHEILRNMNIIS